jgi:hypothetical protein
MTEDILNLKEKPKIGPEEEFWKRAASYNLKPGNALISPDDFNRLIKSGKPEDIDEFLSRVMQKKMKLPCKVTGKTIFITLPPRRIHS